jgi:predicted ATP-dependent endonuclease of OLD family
MLTKLILENFRCYSHHTVEFKNLTIVVGKNNAGKSTLVEAMRLVAMACSRLKTSAYKNAPNWLDLPKRSRGISTKTTYFDFNKENVSYLYNEGTSTITAVFSDETKITVHVKHVDNLESEPEFFCTLQDSIGNYVQNKSDASLLSLPVINILPQISAIQKEEKRLASEEYIMQNLATNLSSLHFRNQLSILYDNLPVFKELIESSWPGLQIQQLEHGRLSNKKGEALYSLMVREGGFVTEIAFMGHGLQMWLQIMWFLSRVKDDEIVILDEPDVYMHPDLQRKLMRILKSRFRQIVVSTHSVEIISEVNPEAILIIDKTKEQSLFASEIPMVQGILNSIGSIHNLQLTKIWASKKILLVEGEDIAILKKMQDVLFPQTEEPFDTIPNFDLKGWGGWNYAIGSSRLLKETVDTEIKVYCLFDSDYHTKDEISKRYQDSKRLNVDLHIWQKKEIENYLIVPDLILRVLRKETGKTISSIKEVTGKIEEIIASLKEDTLHSLASELQKNRKCELKTAINEAKKTYPDIEDRIPGKAAISQLSDWTQKKYKISLSPMKLVHNIQKIDIASEVADVIKCIETNKSFIKIKF